MSDDVGGLEAEDITDCSFDNVIGHFAGAEGVHAHAHGIRITDGISELNLGARRQAGSDDVFGHVAAHVGGAAVHFAGVFAAERASAVTAHAAVAVHDDFPAGQTRVALRPADHETAGRIDEEPGVLREQVLRECLSDDLFNAKFLDRSVPRLRAVLRGDDHVGDLHRLILHITDGDLRLRVGTQPLHPSALADAGQFAAELVRVHDRRRHQFRRLRRRVAEHQTLVARALLRVPLPFGLARIDALRDVGALLGDGVDDQHAVGVKNVVLVRVPDVADGLAPRYNPVWLWW